MQGVDDVVLLARHGAVLRVVLNRPHVLNAVDETLATALGDTLAAASADAEIRVVVLAGTGRAFCAGADLGGQNPVHPGHPEWGFGGFVRQAVRMPVIAEVHGFALGGGVELAAACDLVVAARSAVFGLPEVRRGLVATGGGVLRLSRQLPPRVAMAMVLTGDPIDAETALEYGLVNRVVDDADLAGAAMALAGQISRNAPLAVEVAKRLARQATLADGDELWEENRRAFETITNSADAIEGRAAFLAKRDPVWSGR
jgi:crotonobetainyl-CoA hydratase